MFFVSRRELDRLKIFRDKFHLQFGAFYDILYLIIPFLEEDVNIKELYTKHKKLILEFLRYVIVGGVSAVVDSVLSNTP